jgi:undecaprenyl diphosphate synthase
MPKETIQQMNKNMEVILESTAKELSGIRTGRATMSLLDGVIVDNYGAKSPINQVASISIPEARLMVIQPWDKSKLSAIEKALLKADLGLNINSDGKIIRVTVPELTEERRKELVKHAKKLAEEGRIALRNARRDAVDAIKKLEKAGKVPEDDSHKEQDNIQKITDENIKKVDDMMSMETLSEEELKNSLDMKKLPKHIAIIMDGNGRWADRRNLSRVAGHKVGVESVHEAVELCTELEIQVLTLYTFSSENWKRPILEVNALMKLLLDQIREQTPIMSDKNIKLGVIGDIGSLPRRVSNELKKSIDTTKNNTGLILNLALSYGGRQEIIRATRLIAEEVKKGNIKVNEINEEVFAGYLYTAELPDPDIIIRTSGEIRISNFLLWQCAYSEFYITDILWPDFRKKELLRAIIAYQQRNRRFGGI